METGLDEAVGMSVVPGVERFGRRGTGDVPASTSPSKWATEPAFEVGTSVASPSAKTFWPPRLERARSVRTKPSASPSPAERST